MAEMFAPIGGGGRARPSTVKSDDWHVVLPVPEGTPAAPAKHFKRGKPSRTDTYRDAEGRLLGYVLRFDLKDGSKEFLPLTFWQNASGGAEWRWKAWPAPRPLYGLDRLAQRPKAPVIVTEGEKAADAAAKLSPDHVAVTSPNGSQSAKKADWAALAGRAVVIWPDADEAGAKYGAMVARELDGVAISVKVLVPPADAKPGWDAADALAEGWDAARAAAFIAEAEQAGGRKPRQSAGLLALVEDAELWHGPDREAYATVPIAGHFENWPVRSRSFRLWLSRRFFEETAGAPGGQAMEDTLRVIEARAIFNGPEFTPFMRIGELEGAVYLDLADENWRAVRITEQGWEVIDRAPVKFTRSNAMQALPVPEPGGMIEELHDLVNVKTEGDLKLVIAFLIGCFHPRGPYPILALNGEQGSAKSTLTKLIRCLVDPNTAPIRSAPRDEETLVIAAKNSWIVALDNLSDVSAWLADALCRLSTGGGFSRRELYTDYAETVVQVIRPTILNGIPDVASRADLADRTIHLTLPAIDEDGRRSEAEYWADVETRRPTILGALLDGVAGALRRRGEVPAQFTRMADFAAWINAAEPALGWHAGDFLEAFLANRRAAVDTTIEADPIGPALCELVAANDWEGAATELLTKLAELVAPDVPKSRIWPAANKLRGRLRRLQPALRTKGIVLDLDQRKADAQRTRIIIVRRPEHATPAPTE